MNKDELLEVAWRAGPPSDGAQPADGEDRLEAIALTRHRAFQQRRAIVLRARHAAHCGSDHDEYTSGRPADSPTSAEDAATTHASLTAS